MSSELITTQNLEDMTSDEMASSIVAFTSEALTKLNRQRESQYAESVVDLDEELTTLEAEASEIETQRQTVVACLASASRIKRYEADVLTVAGDLEGARVKLEELAEVEAAPGKIEERLNEILNRINQINAEKHTVARRTAKEFLEASITLIRGSETGLADLLDRTRAILNNLETMTSSVIYQPAMLTADERSNEWITLRHHYVGRVR